MKELDYDYYIEVHRDHAYRVKEALKEAVEKIAGFDVNMQKHGNIHYRFFIKFSAKGKEISPILRNLREFLKKKLGREIYIAPNPERGEK